MRDTSVSTPQHALGLAVTSQMEGAVRLRMIPRDPPPPRDQRTDLSSRGGES